VLLPTYCQPKGGKKKMFEIIQVNFNALFSFSYQAGFSESITIPFSSDEEEKKTCVQLGAQFIVLRKLTIAGL
jgi:hypothetical protein